MYFYFCIHNILPLWVYNEFTEEAEKDSIGHPVELHKLTTGENFIFSSSVLGLIPKLMEFTNFFFHEMFIGRVSGLTFIFHDVKGNQKCSYSLNDYELEG